MKTPLPEGHVQRVANATLADLDVWLERVEDRPILADVFAAG